MNIELTEQQARTVAAYARKGLTINIARGEAVEGITGPGDQAAAFKGCEILEQAVQKAIGQ